MKKYINQSSRCVRSIRRKRYINLIPVAIIAFIIALCSCVQTELTGEQESAKTIKNDSTAVKDTIHGFGKGNSEDVTLTEE